MAKQEITGKAFEYACLKALFDKFNSKTEVSILSDVNVENTKKAFDELSENEKSDYAAAARRGIEIIAPLEPNLEFPDQREPLILSIQPDKQGQKGDVRDVLCLRNIKGWEIGFSCKHNHEAVKHSRLSGTLDFGEKWVGHPVSKNYWNSINPIFKELSDLRTKKIKWEDVPDKDKRFYEAPLKLFLEELSDLYKKYPDTPEKLMLYMLGSKDFYKIISHEKDKTTEVKPFNMYGTLGLSTKERKSQSRIQKLKMPTEILKMDFKKDSSNTVELYFDSGWALSLRIHSADKTVESSLKFDAQLIGVPVNMGTRIEAW